MSLRALLKHPALWVGVVLCALTVLWLALGAPVGMSWQDAEIVSEHTGRPLFEIRGTVLARAEALGVRSVHVSLSHDAGIASAMVVLEG